MNAVFFGLLTQKSAQRLGEISYGIYLLQGIVLFTFVQIPEIRSLAISTSMHYWGFLLIEAFTLIIIAYIAYYFLEKPELLWAERSYFSMSIKSLPKKQSRLPTAL